MGTAFSTVTGLILVSLSQAAPAWVTVHVETDSAQQAGLVSAPLVESFSKGQAGSFTSSFGGSGLTGSFAGFAPGAATHSGFGASGFGVVTAHATIKLDRTVKYFGYRTAALDGNNTVELFSNGTSLGFFSLVDSPAGAGFGGAAPRTGFTYVNFFSDQTFDEVRFTQSAGSAQIDDIAIAQVTAVPEAATWGLMIAGFGLAGAALRTRRSRRARMQVA